jgi:hypothetical protein
MAIRTNRASLLCIHADLPSPVMVKLPWLARICPSTVVVPAA